MGERTRCKAHALRPLDDRGPLRVMFVTTSMPVGGAETLLVNLVRRLDRERFLPELCCLKQLGPLGEELAREVPVHANLLTHKYDLRVLPRLVRLLRWRRIDALVTVGAGDKMFWGRLAASWTGMPVILSALHSTGWPDSIGRLNRWLTPWTDALIAVAEPHGQYLRDVEGFAAEKVVVIPNGIDADRFCRCPDAGARLRQEWGLAADDPICGIVAALRPEKNHELFLRAAARVRAEVPRAHFVIVGDGPERPRLEQLMADLGLRGQVRLLGTRGDIPDILSALDVFALTSHIEANPVSILEALASEVPVVATRVGSVSSSVVHGVTGLLAEAGCLEELAGHITRLLRDPAQARAMGQAGRARVLQHWSLDRMVRGYEQLIVDIYGEKVVAARAVVPAAAAARQSVRR